MNAIVPTPINTATRLRSARRVTWAPSRRAPAVDEPADGFVPAVEEVVEAAVLDNAAVREHRDRTGPVKRVAYFLGADQDPAAVSLVKRLHGLVELGRRVRVEPVAWLVDEQ